MEIILETARCYLRKMTSELDAENAFELNNDFDVIKYTGDVAFANVEAAKLFLDNYKDYERNNMGSWAVIRKLDNAWLGWCGLKLMAETNEVDLGYRLHQQYWNDGYATECALACVHYGFDKLFLDRIIGRVESGNIGSIRVLEKCGMQLVKHTNFNGNDGLEYELLKTKFI